MKKNKTHSPLFVPLLFGLGIASSAIGFPVLFAAFKVAVGAGLFGGDVSPSGGSAQMIGTTFAVGLLLFGSTFSAIGVASLYYSLKIGLAKA